MLVLAYAVSAMVVCHIQDMTCPGTAALSPVQMQGQSANVVPEVAPDSMPAWLFADSSMFEGSYTSKYALVVAFKSGTSQKAKQVAIDAVGGRVIGGTGDHFYIVQVRSDSTGVLLHAAERKLRGMPQVGYATLLEVGGVTPNKSIHQ
jgi:hypothetical protein